MTTTEEDAWMDQEIQETKILTSLIISITESLNAVEQSMTFQAASLEFTAEILATWAQLFELTPQDEKMLQQSAPKETPSYKHTPKPQNFKPQLSKPFGRTSLAPTHRDRKSLRAEPGLNAANRPATSATASSQNASMNHSRRQTVHFLPKQLGMWMNS